MVYCKDHLFLYACQMLTREISARHVKATRYDRGSGEALDWHEHHNLSLCFVIKGDYEETTRQQTVTCRPGDVVIKTANVRHLNKFGQRGARCLLLEISEKVLRDSAGLIEPELNGRVHNRDLARIGLELHDELQAADRLSPFMLEGIALRSLVCACRLGGRKSRRQVQVEAVRELLDTGVGIEELAQKYLTANERKTVRRLFYETEGCSINTYIVRRRAFQAFDELLNTDHSLAEIALRAGFYDQAHFTKVFATLFGVTPGRLRARIN
jgi:AraC family transcriptional regulator